jgi:hypothetical protein
MTLDRNGGTTEPPITLLPQRAVKYRLDTQKRDMEIAAAKPMLSRARLRTRDTMSVVIRRRAAENAFQRAREAGYIVEQDERFHAWIEEWINGDIQMPEVARRYRSLLAERSAKRKDRGAVPATEDIQYPSPSGTEPPFDLETEINRLMFEDEQAPNS